MADPIDLQQQDHPQITTPFVILTPKGGPVGDATFGAGGSADLLTYMVPWGERTQFIYEVLGSAEPGPSKINRRLPAVHPYYPQLRASRITTVKGMKPLGKKDYGLAGPEAEFLYAVIGVAYAVPRVGKMLDDGEVTYEYERYCTFATKPRVEFLQLEKGTFKYHAGAPAGIAGVQFKQGAVIRKETTLLTVRWSQVPVRYVSNQYGFFSRIQNCVGKLNNDTIFGCRAGTLLCEQPDASEEEAPLPGSYLGLGFEDWPRYYTVQLNFIHFDPPTAGAEFGHNLAPAPQLADANWHLIVSETGQKRYQSANFNFIFLPVP